jgi:hypothetical protein
VIDPSQRLRRLERILAEAKAPSAAAVNDCDAATARLASVPLERIRQITAELLRPSSTAGDDVDALTIRLLLNDYATAVTHLRAVVREAGERIDAAASPIKDTRRFLWRAEKLRTAASGTLQDAPSDD